MHTRTKSSRVLAIDLRTQRFGYAAFEGSKRLLDFGARAFAPGGTAGAQVAATRVAALIKLFHPSVIVIREEHRGHGGRTPDMTPVLTSINCEAKFRSIPVCVMPSEEMKEAFRPFRARTKHEVATMLSGIFPELLWKLPRKRRTWDPERHIVAVFDAIALGFAYCINPRVRTPPKK